MTDFPAKSADSANTVISMERSGRASRLSRAIPWMAAAAAFVAQGRASRAGQAALDFVATAGAGPGAAAGVDSVWTSVVGAVLAAAAAHAAGAGRLRNRAACAVGAVVAVALAARVGNVAAYLFPAVAFAMLAAAAAVRLRPAWLATPLGWIAPRRRPAVGALAGLALVLALSGSTRVAVLTARDVADKKEAYLLWQLEPDAQGYYELAFNQYSVHAEAWTSPAVPGPLRAPVAYGHYFYHTVFREPGFIWFLRYASMAGGIPKITPATCRVASVLLGLAALSALYWYTFRRAGLVAALLAGYLYATSRVMVWVGVQVLREDTIVLTFVAFVAMFERCLRRPAAYRPFLALGALAGICALVRLNSHMFLDGALVLAFAATLFRHRPRGVAAAAWLRSVRPATWAILPAAFTVMWLPIVPHMAYMKANHGDAMHAVNVHTKFYRNREFIGQPGFMTVEEFQKTAHGGPPVSLAEYMFKLHTPAQVAAGMKDGAVRMLFGESARMAYQGARPNPAADGFWYIMHLAGLAALVAWRRLRWFAFLLAAFHAPGLFILQFPWVEPRLASLAFAGFHVGCGAAVALAWWLFRRWRADSAPSPANGQVYRSRAPVPTIRAIHAPRTGPAAPPPATPPHKPQTKARGSKRRR